MARHWWETHAERLQEEYGLGAREPRASSPGAAGESLSIDLGRDLEQRLVV